MWQYVVGRKVLRLYHCVPTVWTNNIRNPYPQWFVFFDCGVTNAILPIVRRTIFANKTTKRQKPKQQKNKII